MLNEETGETYLCRMEPKTGKRQIVKTRRFGGPSRPTKCYRCGRTGHISTECHAKTHVDGGAPRPKPLPRQANSIEDDAVSIHSRPTVQHYQLPDTPNPQELGICDICGIETEEDPWNKGDPWMAHGAAAVSISITAPIPMTFPSVWNPTVCCSWCTKEGVYERHKQKTMAVVSTAHPIAANIPSGSSAVPRYPVQRRIISQIGWKLISVQFPWTRQWRVDDFLRRSQ